MGRRVEVKVSADESAAPSAEQRTRLVALLATALARRLRSEAAAVDFVGDVSVTTDAPGAGAGRGPRSP
jgi:hypothetical protein